jgi:NitT/TauT family transport system substrate-binding protein
MKKWLICILYILTISLSAGCQNKPESLLMMVPFGSPQLSQIYLQDDEYYQVDIVMGPDLLVSAFGSETHDVIFAPTNLGAQLYKNGSPYRLAAVVVWGNFYLASKHTQLNDISELSGKTIHAFGQNQTADIILRYLLEQNEVEAHIVYVDSVATAQGLLISDQADIILTAEPSLSILKQNVSDLKSLDLQAVYQLITGDASYPQAGVFVHERVNALSIEKLRFDLEASITKTNEALTSSAQRAIDLGMNIPLDALILAIPNSHLRYVRALDAKSAIDNYFQIILTLNPNLIGGQLPDDDFYIQ